MICGVDKAIKDLWISSGHQTFSLYKCLKLEPLHKFRLQQIDVKTIQEEELKNLCPIFLGHTRQQLQNR